MRAVLWSVLLIALICAVGADGVARRLDPGEMLSEAIRGAGPGEIIELAPGTYEGFLFINSSVTVRGRGDAEAVVLRSPGPGTGLLVQIESPREIEVVFENLTIENRHGAGLQVEGAVCLTLRRVVVSRALTAGILVRGRAHVGVVDTLIRDCGSCGVEAWDAPTIDVQASEISTCGGCGVRLWDNATLSIVDSLLRGHGEHGVVSTCGAALSITGTRIVANAADGVHLASAGLTTLWSNDIEGNGGYGVRAAVDGCVVGDEPAVLHPGEIRGSGNRIPQPAGGAAGLGAICPSSLAYLAEPSDDEP